MPNGFGPPRFFRPRSFPRYREYNTLLKVANPIPDEVLYGPDGNTERWLAGIDYNPIPLGVLDCYGPDCDVVDDWTDEASEDTADDNIFSPMEIRASVECSTIGLDQAELRDRLDARLLGFESQSLTAALIGGFTDDLGPGSTPCWSNNPTIAGTGEGAATIAFNAVVPIDEAVARLEDGIALQYGDVLGTIFMTPGMLTMLQNRGGLIFENGCWWTATGTAIVADGGVGKYAGPDFTTPDPDLQAGFESDFQWVYATGPVYAHRGPLSYTPVAFATDSGNVRVLPRNIMRFETRRHVIAVFDQTVRLRVPASYSSSVSVS